MGRDTWNLCHNFNPQGLAFRILSLRVAISKSQGPISRILGVTVKVPVPGSWVSGSRVPRPQSSRVPGLRGVRAPGLRVLGSRISALSVPGPRTQVLILDYAV